MTEKKQQVHIRIDWDVYFTAKQKDTNISGLVNTLLKSYFDQEIKNPQKDEIQQEISTHRQIIEESKLRLVRLQAEILKLEEEEQKEQKELDEKNLQFAKGIKASGALRDII